MPSELIRDMSGIDLGTADRIAPRLSESIEAGGDYRIDTGDWTRCDLAGLAVLLSALRTAGTRGARLSVEMPPGGCVDTMIRACGIDPAKQLELHDGRATGLHTVQSQGS